MAIALKSITFGLSKAIRDYNDSISLAVSPVSSIMSSMLIPTLFLLCKGKGEKNSAALLTAPFVVYE